MISAAAILLLSMAQGTAPPLIRIPDVPPAVGPAAPPGPPAPIKEHARPRAGLASLVTNDDYPLEALRAAAQGKVEFALDIGSNGRVTDCRITRTSGSAALDSTTCRLMMARARFLPASDPAGRLVPDTYAGNIVWRIGRAPGPESSMPAPQDIPRPQAVPVIPLPPILRPPPPAPPRGASRALARARLTTLISSEDYPASALRANEQGSVLFMLDVGPDGRVSGCAITRSSGSATLDSTTCRIMRVRARFIPARDSAGNPTADTYAGKFDWRIDSDIDQPFVPLQFVEEMRADSAGALSCWSASNGGPPEAKPCPPGDSGPGLARLARANRMPLTLSTVTALTPAGAADLPDRKARGDLYRASEALLTIAADGSILECRDTSGQFFGGGNSGVPPSPCIDWFPTRKVYAPAEQGAPPRTVKVTVRGYAAHSFRKARR